MKGGSRRRIARNEVIPGPAGLLPAIRAWLDAEQSVKSAVLFGSSARQADAPGSAGDRSDFDLHVVTTAAARLEHVDWPGVFPREKFCLQVVRPATGGVRKVTVVFASGGIDLVLVPAARLKLIRRAMERGLHRRQPLLRVALNEMATCLHSGYRFLKGEKVWGPFYARVAGEMPGVRLADAEAAGLADVFLCDLWWVLQKLERGELSAAQHLVHRSLAETNFRLVRELRLRRGQPLPSFGLGRRVETLLSPEELTWVRVDARLRRKNLGRAAWSAFAGLKALMRRLVPAWQVPAGMRELLERHSIRPGRAG
jgi:hypothetical protein